MKVAGIEFRQGLTAAELDRAETLYGIRFPAPLRDLLGLGLPFGWDQSGVEPRQLFPQWNDFSQENEALLRDWIESPVRWLKRDVMKSDFWVSCWGERPDKPEEREILFDRSAAEAPVMIPVFGHRFIVDGSFSDDPPIFSTIGWDIIRYGSNFDGWIEAEFSGDWKKGNEAVSPAVPFWDEVVRENLK